MADGIEALLRSMKMLKRFYPAIRLISLGFFIGVFWQAYQGEKAAVRKELDSLSAAVKVLSETSAEDHDLITKIDITTQNIDRRLTNVELRPAGIKN